MKNNIIIELIFVVSIFILVSIFSDKNPIKDGIPTCLCLIGICWLIITIFTLFLQSWGHSILSISLSIMLILIGGFFKVMEPEKPKPTQDQMGNCEEAEWIIRIHYKDKYDINSIYDLKCYGNTKSANEKMSSSVESWKKEHTNNTPTKYEKILYFLPKEYVKKHRYPEVYSQRF